MLLPCLIGLGMGQKLVVDSGVDFRLLPAAMATGVLRARATEGGEGGAGLLQGDDVVLLVPLVGVERPCTDGSTGGRAARSSELTGAVEGGATVRETEIGWAEKYQWITVMPWWHWIGARGWFGWLTTVARRRGGGRVKGGGRSRRK
jgi:hypothetical protein